MGTQAQFRKTKPPQRYRYDDSLSPALEWDLKNPARDQGEALIRQVLEARSLEEAKAAAEKLKAMSKPFLNWAGKGEKQSFEVPTLPLFIHERLSTTTIIETLKTHQKASAKEKQSKFGDWFGDPQRPVVDQVLGAYTHRDEWVNRMLVGDSLVVMNSLLHYEGLGGQVQMIYMDPPYGVKFGSNFQPFVRKRDVKHGDDEDMTREPEMVQAYRDTWELGLHSYLTYMRDRLRLARDLLTPSGSIFVQISDENFHHVKELLDEHFGADNFIATIAFKKKKMPLGETFIFTNCDYLIWYAKDRSRAKFHRLFTKRDASGDGDFGHVELPNGECVSRAELGDELPKGARLFQSMDLRSSGRTESCVFEAVFQGKKFFPSEGRSWKTNREGMETLAKKNRLFATATALRYKLYLDDYPVQELSHMWMDTQGPTDKQYVVQTSTKVVERCMLMTTEPGDLVLDPTCGSGTTAYVAEQWGRRWITCDTSRVPLALARQRLLTATFPWYELKDEARGPAGGFVYARKQNRKGEEVGGIVPHVTVGTVANDEPPEEEILVDRPEEKDRITRVSGPFTVEATIPTPTKTDGKVTENVHDKETSYGSFVDRMLEVLRKSPVLHIAAGKTANLKNVRSPAKTLSLSAEALLINGQDRPVAFIFGPENGAISEKLVYEAAKEAAGKDYKHLYVIGFAIQPHARKLVDECDKTMGISATYVQATPDLMMGDLLKNMRSSQIFSVCGLPELKLRKAKGEKGLFQVELLGLDVFDPVDMRTEHRKGDDVPAWLLDTDYNGLCFHVTQAFFPRTAAWDSLKRALKATHEASVWDHLAGTVSAPFEAGEQIAVKVIDDRGNELLVVKKLDEVER